MTRYRCYEELMMRRYRYYREKAEKANSEEGVIDITERKRGS